jgi:hypothetical protein
MRRHIARRLLVAVIGATTMALPLLLSSGPASAAPLNGCTAKATQTPDYCTFNTVGSTVDYRLSAPNGEAAVYVYTDCTFSTLLDENVIFSGHVRGSFTGLAPGDCVYVETSGTKATATAKG